MTATYTYFSETSRGNLVVDREEAKVSQALSEAGVQTNQDKKYKLYPDAESCFVNSDTCKVLPKPIHQVSSGESIAAISRRYEVSTSAVKKVSDNQNPNLIFPGQFLIIDQMTSFDPLDHMWSGLKVNLGQPVSKATQDISWTAKSFLEVENTEVLNEDEFNQKYEILLNVEETHNGYSRGVKVKSAKRMNIGSNNGSGNSGKGTNHGYISFEHFGLKFAANGKLELSKMGFSIIRGSDGKLSLAYKLKMMGGVVKYIVSGKENGNVVMNNKCYGLNLFADGEIRGVKIKASDLKEFARMMSRGDIESARKFLDKNYSSFNDQEKEMVMRYLQRGFASLASGILFTSFSITASGLIVSKINDAYKDATGREMPTEFSVYLNTKIFYLINDCWKHKSIDINVLKNWVSGSKIFLPQFLVMMIWGQVYDAVMEKFGLENDPLARTLVQMFGSRITKFPKIDLPNIGEPPFNNGSMVPVENMIHLMMIQVAKLKREQTDSLEIDNPLPAYEIMDDVKPYIGAVGSAAGVGLISSSVGATTAVATSTAVGGSISVGAGGAATLGQFGGSGLTFFATAAEVSTVAAGGASAAGGVSTATAAAGTAGAGSLIGAGVMVASGLSVFDWFYGRSLSDRRKLYIAEAYQMINENDHTLSNAALTAINQFFLGNYIGDDILDDHPEILKAVKARLKRDVERAYGYFTKVIPNLIKKGIVYEGKLIKGMSAYTALMSMISDEEKPAITQEMRLKLQDPKFRMALAGIEKGEISIKDINYEELGFSNRNEMLSLFEKLIHISARNHAERLATENTHQSKTKSGKVSRYFNDDGTFKFETAEQFGKFAASIGLNPRFAQIQYPQFEADYSRRYRLRNSKTHRELILKGLVK